MPFKSRAQARMMFAKPSTLGGMAKVKEWASVTDFKHLPEKKKPPKFTPKKK